MAASFFVELPGDKENECYEQVNLQDAFRRFKKQRQCELERSLSLTRKLKAEPEAMDKLRTKFVETAMRYIGVPYARRYHEPSSPTYHSKLFLDCCGLVRKVLKDLQEDFGFIIGPGNQAYQFDTLPIALDPEEMKPGDLVFISGTYYDSKKKAQKHDMVHVEIWLGDGEKTIGARWQKGCVEIHNSYKFESKSYHSMVYHFRSIDTWLTGECQSYCKEHPWQVRSAFVPGRKSIFSFCNEMEESADPQEQGPCEMSCDRLCGPVENQCLVLQDISDSGNNPVVPSQLSGSGRPVTFQSNSHTQLLGSSRLSKSTSVTGEVPKAASKAKPIVKATKCGSPKFYIGGKNGGDIVESALLQRGWERIHDNSTPHFYLKWVELKSQIHYASFKEGEQLVNHFPNIGLLTTKIGLLDSLQELERSQSKLPVRTCPEVSSFYPQTFRLDNPVQRDEFFSKFKDGGRWICKPSGMNQGKGIFLVESVEQVKDLLSKDQIQSTPSKRPPGRIVQRYLENPLLLNGKKFDIRAYMLVIAGTPFVLLYHHGYLRLTCQAYEPGSSDLSVHLTNQYVQRKHSSYVEVKEDTIWSYEKFQEYLSEHFKDKLPDNWVDSTLKVEMQSIMKTCFQSVRRKLQNKLGFFDILGFDFMIDSKLKVWLIEVNVNPAMHTSCRVLQELIPKLLHTTLDVTIDVFERQRHGKALPDLLKYGCYEILVI